MKYSALIFGFFLLLFACNNKPEEVVNFDDLTASSEKYKEGNHDSKTDQIKVSVYDSLSVLSQQLIDTLGFDHTQLALLDTTIFPDRFGAKHSEKWYLKTATDSLVFIHWTFKDSIKTENAFFNWLDCYGKNCKSIHVGDEVAFSKRATTFILQDRDLFFIESSLKIDPEQWLAFFDQQKWDKKRKFIVVQAPRKKAVWKKRDSEGKILDFELKIP